LDLDHGVGHIVNVSFIQAFHDRIGRGHNLLRGGLKRACFLGLRPEVLNGIHQVHGLFEKCLAQIHRPIDVPVHFRDHLRKLGHGFNLLVPRLLVHLGNVVGILYKPGRLHDLQRVN
jgi:hypothetical protein